MASAQQNKIDIQALKARLDAIDAQAKTGDQLNVANSITSNDFVYVVVGNETKKYPANSVVKTPFFVDVFIATQGQTSYTVSNGQIADNGLWTVQVGSELWNSTTGITSFTDGNVSITFATGVITFNIPLEAGTQVIIKYN